MKNKITIIFILIIVATIFFSGNNVYAAISNNINYQIVSVDAGWGAGTGDTEKRALEDLSGFGYEDEMKDEMRWETTIGFYTNSKEYYDASKQANGKFWKIKIGNTFVEEEIDYNTAKNKYACEDKEPKKEAITKKISGNGTKDVQVLSYKAVIIAKKDLSNMATSHDAVGNGNAGIAIYLDSIYTKGDMEEGRNIVLSDKNTEIAAVKGTEEVKNPFEEILAKLLMTLIDLLRAFYGDGPQILINTIQTSTFTNGIKKFVPWEITYEGEEYIQDVNKNLYVNFSQDGSNEGTGGQKKKTVLASQNGFSEETLIPVIPVDFYTMAAGKVSAFDTNFLTGQNNKKLHEDGSAWVIIRNLAAALIHITIYIGAAFLLGSLIIHGISIVNSIYIKHEEETPEKRKEHIDGIHNFSKSLMLLIGSVIIMGLCIFVSNALFEDMKVTDTNEFPIRVILKDSEKIYSFSTNVTGYVRYMSQISNASLIGDKFMYTVIYIVFVLINVAAVICMFVRFWMLMGLSIIGPLIAVANSMNKKELFGMTYQEWTISYIKWSSIQLIFAIAYRIMLEVSF